jgi:hypothetical protein
MAGAPDIRVKLSADGVEEVVRALQKVQAQAKKTSDEAKKGGGGFKIMGEAMSDLQGLIPAIGLAEGVKGLVEITKGAIESADAMAKLSKKTGISVESLSVLGLGAELADVGIEGLAKGLKKMQVAMYDLETGGGAAAIGFRQIGLGAKDLQGLKTDEAFLKIANAVAKLPPGFVQTNAAVKIFGKSGADLIPMMQELSGSGFEELQAKAQKLGLVMNSETAADAETLNDELKVLEKTVKATALSFAAGMMNSLLGVTRQMEGNAAASKDFFASVGVGLGLVVESLTTGLELIGRFTGALSVIDWSKLMNADVIGFFKSLKSEMAGVIEEMDRPLNDAIKALPEKVTKIRAQIAKLPQEQQGEQLGKLTGAMNQGSGNRRDLSKMVISVDMVGKTVDAAVKAREQVAAEAEATARERAIKLSKDLSATAQGQASNELTIQQSKIKAQQEMDKELYDAQIIDLVEYYRLRRESIDALNSAELEAMKKKRTAIANEKLDPNDPGAAMKKAQELAAIDAQVQAKKIDQQTARNAMTDEERQKLEDLGKRRLELEAQIMDAQGLTYAAAIARIDAQAKELKKQGIDPATVDKLANAQKQGALFKENQTQAGAGMDALGMMKQGLDTKEKGGELFPTQAAQQYQAAINTLLPTLREYAQAMRDAAITPEEIKAAEDYTLKLDDLAVSANQDAIEMGKFKAGLEAALTSDLTNFFTTGIEEANSFGDAMKGLANAVLESLKKMAAQMLANIAIQQMMKAVEAMGYSGGGYVAKYAEGGQVVGPGTGTSDSIPAMLSHGEFVVQSKAVAQPGVLSMLAALNGGGLRGSAGPRFATGGLVSASDVMGQGVTLDASFGLDEGVVMRQMKAYTKSADGQRDIIKGLSMNQKKASQAIGR